MSAQVVLCEVVSVMDTGVAAISATGEEESEIEATEAVTDSNLELMHVREVPKTIYSTFNEAEVDTSTAMNKSNMTIYLSCKNVISTKTFCEVKVQVCVSVYCRKAGEGECVTCAVGLLLKIVTHKT